MKIFRRIFLCVILFFSCKGEKKSDILPENKMTQIMWDMIRADQYVTEILSKDSTRNKKDESIRLYEEIFQLHKITQEQFKKSLRYYSSRPDLFSPIIDSLASRKNELMAPSKSHPAVVDSLTKPSLRRHFPKR